MVDQLQRSIQTETQLSTEHFYREFPKRAVPADVHGILIRVASLEDTLRGKIKAWSDARGRQSKQIKDLGDIARLIEAHPELWEQLDDLKKCIVPPEPTKNSASNEDR